MTVGNHLVDNNKIKRQCKEGLDFSLLMVLWILATPDTFRSVGVKFGIHKYTVHFHYTYMIEAIREMAPRFIQWPKPYEQEIIAQIFEDRYGYPSVIGCIDGCLIRITAPLEQPQSYVDRHHEFSINLQAVCEDRMVFRDIFVGQPGSVGDKKTFKRSQLGRNILRRLDVMNKKHLLGDGGYTLTSKVWKDFLYCFCYCCHLHAHFNMMFYCLFLQLLIPYINRGNLTRRLSRVVDPWSPASRVQSPQPAYARCDTAHLSR